MQVFTLFGGGCLFLICVLVTGCGHMHWLGVVVVIGAFGIAFPLMYLRALRCLHIKTKNFQNNQQLHAPDALSSCWSRPPEDEAGAHHRQPHSKQFEGCSFGNRCGGNDRSTLFELARGDLVDLMLRS